MNKNAMRGLALAAITGGLSILGVTAANAVDLPDLGGTSGDSILDSLRVDLPVTVDGLNVSVLDSNGASSLLGDGVFASTGDTTAKLFAQLGIDTSGVFNYDMLTSTVGVPVDVSNSWVSVLGKEPNGIVVVPHASIPAFAWVTGIINAFITVPVNISCTSVSVISDFENDCGDTTGVGTGVEGLLGGLLAGGTHNGLSVDVSDVTIRVLDGDTLDLGTLGGDGVLVDPTNGVTDLNAVVRVVGGQTVLVAAPVDASDAWVSVFGENGGIVIVPDSRVDGSLITAGLIDSATFAPISLDCITVTVLSDFDRDCAGGSTSVGDVDLGDVATPGLVDLGSLGLGDLGTLGLVDLDTLGLGDLGTLGLGDVVRIDLGDLETHALPVPDDAVTGNGGNGGNDDNGDVDNGDACVAGIPTAADTANGADPGLVGAAALGGVLAGFGLMGLGRRLHVL